MATNGWKKEFCLNLVFWKNHAPTGSARHSPSSDQLGLLGVQFGGSIGFAVLAKLDFFHFCLRRFQ
ncbi:hypothetical protein IWQ52_000263 [Labrenzia sp. EL_159]|nr:hypothetical protein [Labrenzia sp. EL_162]MBG6192761.1 hypothetical protein [Labrenzia sp. EL_159]